MQELLHKIANKLMPHNLEMKNEGVNMLRMFDKYFY